MSEGVYKGVDCGTYTVIFEDDGAVAYGYLLKDGKIIADVWLYNCTEAPDEIKQFCKDAPPLNSKKYISEESYNRIQSEDEVNFEFYENTNTCGMVAEIILRGNVFAVLEHDSKVGWSRLAKLEGPLAKPLLKKYAR